MIFLVFLLVYDLYFILKQKKVLKRIVSIDLMNKLFNNWKERHLYGDKDLLLDSKLKKHFKIYI